MTPPKKDDTTEKDMISICYKLIEVFTASMAQNAEMLKELRTQNEIQRLRNERTEAFLFMGDPAKGIPSFVSEVRDGLGDNKGAIKRTQETITSAQETIVRAIWIVVTVLITAGVSAAIYFRLPPAP